MNKINLTPRDIVDKHFQTKMRGYDPTDVDEFLDSVIQDYESYVKELRRLQNENDRLVSKVDELTKQVAVGKSSQAARPANAMTNMDIMKRLSNLERHVFGAQLNDNNDQQGRF